MGERLTGRQVVITGSSGGLGRAVVEAFLAAGAHCHLPLHGDAIDGFDPERISPTPGVDLTDDEAVTAYYAGLPPIWASVHLAGGFAANPITEIDKAALDGQLALNLTTAYLCCREAVRAMRAAGVGGRIVNVGSRVSEAPAGGMTAYAAAKGAVASLTRSLAEEVKRDDILVNAVLPSVIDTPANRAAMPNADPGRWPKPAEIAGTILWLASPVNRLTTGGLIPVYGKA